MRMRPYAREPDGSESARAGGLPREFTLPPLVESFGLDDGFFAGLAVQEALGEAEAGALFAVEALREAEGHDDDLVAVVAVQDAEGHAEVPLVFAVEDLQEAEGHDPGEVFQLQALQEGQGGDDELVGFMAFQEKQGGAEALLVLAVENLSENQGHADKLVLLATWSEGQGHATTKHSAQCILEVDRDAWIDATAGQTDTNHDASAVLSIDSAAATETHTLLRFNVDHLKPISRTFNQTATNPARRIGGEILWFQMDDDDVSGSDLTDSSGLGLTGTLNGTTSVAGPGGRGEGRSFDAVDDSIELKTPLPGNHEAVKLHYGIEFTIGFWFRRNGNPAGVETTGGTKTGDGAVSPGWHVQLNVNGTLFIRLSDGVTQYVTDSDGTTSITDDAWHRVVVKRKITGDQQATTSWRFDAVPNGSDIQGDETPVPTALQLVAGGGVFYLGRTDNAKPRWFGGSLSKFFIAPYAMSDADADDVLDNPYQTVVGAKTLDSASLLLTTETGSAVAQSVRAFWLPDHAWDPATVTWDRRNIRNLAFLVDWDDFVGLSVGTGDETEFEWEFFAAGAAGMLTRMREQMETGQFNLLLVMQSAVQARTFHSKESATAAKRPRIDEVFTFA